MTFDEGKKELKSYLYLERTKNEMEQWIKERKEGTNKLTAVISSDPKGSPIVQDQMAEKLSKILDIEADINEEIIKLQNKQNSIVKKVLQLEQPYKGLLFAIYIQGNNIEKAGKKIGYARSQTFRKRDYAIELYSKIRFEI